MSALRTTRRMDRDHYILTDPSGVNDGIVVFSENEAFDLWSADQSWDVLTCNPIEGWSHPLNDDFVDRLAGDQIEARSMQRHYDSLRVSA